MLGHRLVHSRIYPLYLILATFDIVFTWIIIASLGGSELNVLADWVIRSHGLPGMIVLKFASLLLVVLICEWIHSRRPAVSRGLITAAIGLSLVPVVVGGVILGRVALHPHLYAAM